MITTLALFTFGILGISFGLTLLHRGNHDGTGGYVTEYERINRRNR